MLVKVNNFKIRKYYQTELNRMKSAVWHIMSLLHGGVERRQENPLNPDLNSIEKTYIRKALYVKQIRVSRHCVSLQLTEGRELFYFALSFENLSWWIMSTASLYRRFLPSPPAIDFASVEGKVWWFFEIEIRVFGGFSVTCCLWCG